MNEQSANLIRSITGPVILITVGSLFAIDKFTQFHFGQTWPVLLIVIGLLKLAAGRRRPAMYVPPPPPPVNPAQPGNLGGLR